MVISKKSRQKIYHDEWCPYAKRVGRKYRREVTTDEAKRRGYVPCAYCGGMHGIYKVMLMDQNLFGKPRKKLKFSYDRGDQALCFRSNVGFWKIKQNQHTNLYNLYHLNKGSFYQSATDKQLMHGYFHRQRDVDGTDSMQKIVNYIYEHDKAKQIMCDNNYRNLPQKTKKQRKYYKQAKKKAIRKEINRVNDIFAKLEREREAIKHG